MTLLYPKIYPPYERFKDGPWRGKLDISKPNPDFVDLKYVAWKWYEKIDGTNIRVIWDGYQVTLGGRTENAQIPVTLSNYLTEKFTEELFEEKFGKKKVVFFGEGTSPGIQSSGNYSSEPLLYLFDVVVEDYDHPCGWWWLREGNITHIGEFFHAVVAPKLVATTIEHATKIVQKGVLSNYGHGEFYAEGLVGKLPYLGRDGHRLMTKLKRKDLIL